MADGGRQFVQIQTAARVHAQPGDVVPLGFQQMPQGQHGRVLHPGSDEMSFFRLSFQGGINGGAVAFGPAGGKNDLLGQRADEFRRLLAGSAHVAAHLPAEGMHAGGVAVQFGEHGQHGLHNFGRDPGGGVVVEIDDVGFGHVTPPPR